jgi:hypothetical protein
VSRAIRKSDGKRVKYRESVDNPPYFGAAARTSRRTVLEPMSTLKTVLRVGGGALAVIGVTFLPVRNYVFDKADQSAFADAAELGGFVRAGLAIILVGLVAFGLSFLVRGDLSD